MDFFVYILHWISRHRSRTVRFFGLLWIIMIGGCSTLVNKPATLNDSEKALHWDTLQKQLLAIHNWQINGRIGFKVPGHSGSASLTWIQNNDTYTLSISGPFEQSLAKIRGDSKTVIAHIAGRSTPLKGTSPEQIMLNITGWSLPISGLRYWVRGLPYPDIKSKITLNGQGQPATIIQQGWHITYRGYDSINGTPLPASIKVIGGKIMLNIAINKWQLDHNA